MSKYDHYIKDFLLRAREVSFEKIGTFYLNKAGGDEKAGLSQQIDFAFSKKAQTSDELIDYIVKENGKNKTLISSDLASLFEGARQYINIGKPFFIAGLGTLTANRAGEYEFTAVPGNLQATGAATGNTFEKSGGTTEKKQVRRNAVVLVAFLIILLVTAGLGWGVYKYLAQQKNDPSLSTAPAAADDSALANKTADTVHINQPLQANAGDSATYRFIFETTQNRYRAHNRYDSLKSWGEHVFIDSTTADSAVVYNLFVRAKLAQKDTAYVRDSVHKYFQRPVRIAIN